MTMIKTLTITLVFAFSISAFAQGVPITKTFEVSIFSVRIPVSENGTISIRECDDCDYHSLRVTPRTQYLMNGKAMKLDQFRRALTDMRQHGDTTVNVMRDDASNTVVNVRVYGK